MSVKISVTPDWIVLLWQVVTTLLIVGVVGLFFYVIFKMTKFLKLKRVSAIGNKNNHVDKG